MGNMIKKHFVLFLLFICLAKRSASSPQPQPNFNSKPQIPTGNKHFVLIHGACHGAWSWYKVATLLKDSGHNVTALDLGASGINPIQVQQLPSLSEYVEPLTELMVSLPPKEKVTKRFDFMDSQFRYDNGINNPATSFLFGPNVLATSFYQLSPPQDSTLGLSLVRFSPLYNYDVIKLTEEKYGSVPRVFIVSDQDHAIVLDVQNYMIKNNPPTEVKVIKGSDHMVMLSKSVELFSRLQNIAEKYS
ncbi:methyl jasmonate esterase 1-like isoform X2 [Malus sylvestris]|uniref:methyl jasmonate esterase 1-like isoform X2 n=1 Tax=Malus sylvestris TaxID=3752 RepID=UPI0021AC9BE4|nr:methyl jasmonate esterase 1-like isoform X2 [Malus sylvestris]